MQEITWPLPLNKASQSKDVWKSGATTSPIWELVGIDGTNQGALVPYPGFKEAWIFRYSSIPAGSAGSIWVNNVNPYATNSYQAVVLDFWTFSARIGSDYYCYGVVYLAQRPGSTVRDLIMEGYRTDASPYYFYKVLVDGNSGDVGKLGTTNTDYAISVSSTPRVVYVFIRGLNPQAVTFPTGSVVSVSAGPGVKPVGSYVSTIVSGSYIPSNTLLPNPATSPYVVGSFIVYSSASATPTDWADSSAHWDSAISQRAGDYAFAVQFEDSLSGRRSQLSDSIPVTFASTTGTPTRKFSVVGIVDTAKYDTVKIWRSVRNTNASGVFTAGILQLEATFLASEYAITPSTPTWTAPTLPTTVVKWAYAVQKDDRTLVMQDTFQDRPSFLSAVPFGGASAAYQSQLFVSNTAGQVSDKEDQMKSVGEIRYSSASDGSYELFAPKGRWTPDIYGDSPIAFQQCGQILLGFSGNQVYFIMREGAFVRVMGAHNGYGITSPYALANVGPMVYYVTHQGLRVVYADGRLDEVGAVDWLLSIDWANDLERISMAFDPRTTALYIHNPVKNKTAVMWFSSGTCSELHNVPFTKCTRGLFAKTAGGALEDTSLFLLSETNIPTTSANSAYRARLMVPADGPIDRIRVPNPSNTFEGVHYGLIDGACDRCVLATITTSDSGGTYKFTWATRTYGWTPDYTIIGARIKIVGSATSRASSSVNTDFYQYTFKITGLLTAVGGYESVSALLVTDEVTNPTESPFYGDSPTVLVAINPVVVKVQTAILPGGEEAGMFMNSKQVSSVGALMSGYEYSGAVDSAIGYNQFSRWFANLYRGEEDTVLLKGYSYNPSTDDTKKTIVNGTSPVHAAWNQTKINGTASSMVLGPQWSVEFAAFVVGQTFRLLALSIKGRILDTERNTNNYA